MIERSPLAASWNIGRMRFETASGTTMEPNVLSRV
jgi:hypothetical protein